MPKQENIRAENLLDLDGDRYFIDERGEYEVIFNVSRVAITKEIPHGLNYSLVLLNAKGDREVCFDNANAMSTGSGPGKKKSVQHDHKHLGKRTTPYDFKDAPTLLSDFWKEVDKRL